MIDIATSFALIKGAIEIVNSLRENISDTKFQKELISVYDSLINLKGEILSLQTQNAELSDVNRKLEQRLAEYDNREKTKSRYKLEKFEPGVFAYALKEEFRGEETFHYLCPACMERRQKGIISKTHTNGSAYKCSICNWRVDSYAGPMMI